MFVLQLITGCASLQPLSNYARTGDTVIISLGGTDNYALASVVKQENVALTITDSGSNVYGVKVRNLFRVYSDPTAAYNFRTRTPGLIYSESAVGPHQGIWLAVIDLVDSNDLPVPLATGQASLSVSSPDLASTAYYSGWAWTNGNLNSIPIEILPGTGAPNPLNYMTPISFSPLGSLQPNPQVEVTAGGFPGTVIGGGDFSFSYVNADFGILRDQPYVVSTVQDPNVQIAFSRADQGDGTTLLKVHVTNPHGFSTDNTKSGLVSGLSMFNSLRFQLVWEQAAVDDSNWQNSIQLLESEYFDLFGNTMPELTPVLTKVR